MKKPSAYFHYLCQEAQVRKMDKEWISKTIRYYSIVENLPKDLAKLCSDSAISKEYMDCLAEIQPEENDYLPEELKINGFNYQVLLKEMYEELVLGKEIFFINDWTLTKEGRKKIREYIDKIPDFSNIKPPK